MTMPTPVSRFSAIAALPTRAGDGTVQGYGRYPNLFGQPAGGYTQLYE